MTRWPYPRFIAHRGGGTLAPENTLAGLRLAPRYGYRAVEFDVMLSADGTPFLIHDETLERTTDGAGAVADTPDRILRALDAGSWYGEIFSGECIPTLDEAMRLCLELGLWANIEIKPARGRETETGATVGRLVLASCRRSSLPPPLLSAFSVAALDAARRVAPELPRGLLMDELTPHWRESAAALGCLSVHCNASRIHASGIAAVREAGYGLACYTVNDPADADRLIAAGVDAVFTDRLDRIPAR